MRIRHQRLPGSLSDLGASLLRLRDNRLSSVPKLKTGRQFNSQAYQSAIYSVKTIYCHFNFLYKRTADGARLLLLRGLQVNAVLVWAVAGDTLEGTGKMGRLAVASLSGNVAYG